MIEWWAWIVLGFASIFFLTMLSVAVYYSSMKIMGKQPAEIWFRLRNGYWCEHYERQTYRNNDVDIVVVNKSEYAWRNLQGRTDGTGWEMIDTGMRQVRQCRYCGFAEFR